MGFDLYQLITDRIIAELDKGRVPWRKAWGGMSGAISRATGRPYSILNQLLLPQAGEYVTFKQAVAEGHPVKRGEKAATVFFFTFVDSTDKETGEVTQIPLLRYYSVFHISQCDGMTPRFASSVPSGLQPDRHAEQMLEDYLRRSGVCFRTEQSDQAYYSPARDTIVVPELGRYTDKAECSSPYHRIQ